MLCWRKFYFNLLQLTIKILVSSTIIPSEPIIDLCLDMNRTMLYLLPYKSTADLLTFRNCCLAKNLPDPLDYNEINGTILPRYICIDYDPFIYSDYKSLRQESIKIFYKYWELHQQNSLIDIQIIPVSILLNRSPDYINRKKKLYLKLLNNFKKFFTIILFRRDSFVFFFNAISLRNIVNAHNMDNNIIQKLIRIARIHFFRQRIATVGPIPCNTKDLFNKILLSETIKKAINDESRSKNISYKKAQQYAVALIKEIAANFTYSAVHLSDHVLGWIWNRLYQGINVHNIEYVRELAQKGHEIVYVPCHRSHMDYLLLSYVIYHQGLIPPHIAAGINLNFWPIGPIFRRLGAFFIRRIFKKNKLYSAIFREYLNKLFSQGYSIEYFMEGGRSRTGLLLEPKTGILAITIQTILRNRQRPVTLVPVYIGYEHIIEVETYTKERSGVIKKKENIMQIFKGLSKLRNLGQSYVNFGQPIIINNWLTKNVPEWRQSIDLINVQRPRWLTSAVNKIANIVMVNINKSAAANAINLCSTVLLASRPHIITYNHLLEQLECYLQLLSNVPYSRNTTRPNQTAEELLQHALQMGQFVLNKNNIGENIILPREKDIILTYYKNNIHHMLVLPSLVASIMMHCYSIAYAQLILQVQLLYPMLKKELFLHYELNQLPHVLNTIIIELCRQKLLFKKGRNLLINPERIYRLQLLAAGVRETLQRYAIIISLINDNPSISRNELEKIGLIIAQRLSLLYGVHVSEFFDKSLFIKLMITLRSEGYISSTGNAYPELIINLYNILLVMVNVRDIYQNI
ncbi:Glycerol-3-phosphate acyltransferase [Candidatus Profftia lariciata]|uniref:glycerol-3-phosphate 1-O-acyltransferase PlsB n=1 Tax=Candidatus Profftia lariciata TaxID=1987921 RepID=UPI001D0147D7|nr:glycerol-3-phosphate 1-O-acyltransferase PlsB [Candidatus Profftia lariciata]UDG81569.1 Glycerol-3-phosphate acyltransferase [Candidatus Profftia lariciata]